MGIVLRIFICAVLIATVRCEYPSKDVRETQMDVPDWPPGTDAPDIPNPEQDDLPDWPPPTDWPDTEAPPDAENVEESSAWMVTAIVFIVLFIIAVGLAIYMFVTLPPRYSTNKTFTLPRVNTPAH
ncbi:uncharacterized protein LOC129809709 [Phlebotomus papatasi]|uniref:Uncharacterized protein n=1 Tax=Phlebotomus papatasi TaxID=29031 RepID=A0A1B0DF54_PHLPP|nr:uncharacterized protein LOC129809709 [Phlebotomus papatasi]